MSDDFEKAMRVVDEIKKRLEAATPGKSWIDLLQTGGCWLKLFDSTYTIHLQSRLGNFKQTENDAALTDQQNKEE